MSSLLDRLRQRKLAQWCLGYLAGAWVVLQVLQYLGQSFVWSPQVSRIATILAAAGLFAVVVLAWYHGERGEQRFRPLEVLLLVIIGAAGGSLAWAFRGAPPSKAPDITLIELPPEQNSIAVLPFADLRGGVQGDYFSEGITEEILNTLARTPGLRVAARTSSFAFKGKDVPIDEIARRLRVAHVLEGSVRKDGTRVRITVDLVDAVKGFHLWSQRFDRQLIDIFRIQEEVSEAIVAQLRIQLANEQAPAHTPTENPDAYDLFLRGRYLWAKRTPEGLQRAAKYFEQAIRADSTFAAAYANLAGALLVLPQYVDMKPEEVRPRARAATQRALALDSTLADAWAALAYIQMSYDHDWVGADSAFRKALELKPNDSNTLMWYADFTLGQGRTTDAVTYYERSVTVDPLSAARRFSLGWVYMMVRRMDESEAQLKRAIELDPSLVDSYTHLARVRILQGRYDEGIKGLEDAVARSNRRAFELGALGWGYALAGRPDDARKVLTELQARRSTGYVTQLADAMVFTGLHDFDKAFAALEQARKDGDMWLTENNPDAAFEPLHGDRRWTELLKQMGIEQR